MLVGSKPTWVSFAFISGSLATLRMAFSSLSAIGFGVLVGTKKPVHTLSANPG